MRRSLVVLIALAAGAGGGLGAYSLLGREPGARPWTARDSAEPAAAIGSPQGEAIAPAPAVQDARVARSPVTARAPSEPPVPAELSFLSSDAMRGDRVQAALESADFDAVLTRIARESDARGIANANHFREGLTTYLGATDGRYRVDRIACTQRMCFAAIQAPATADEAEFLAATTTMSEAGKHRFFALMTHRLQRPDQQGSEFRVAFTVVPNRAGITVPIEKPKPASPRG